MDRTVGLVMRPASRRAAGRAIAELARAHPRVTFLVEAEGHHAPRPALAEAERASPEEIARRADMVLVLGGDGTLLHAASLVLERKVPLLGVNMGHIGFLTEVTAGELAATFPRALAGELPHEDRMRLDVRVMHADGRAGGAAGRILNDASVSMRSLARIAAFSVHHDGRLVTSVRGDGVLFSTPTGSTAYTLAAGGPIVYPTLDAIVITPICPHQLTHRPLVVPASGTWSVTQEGDSDVFASLDGHTGCELSRGDRLVLTRAPVPTRILHSPTRDHFRTLREKLRWGEVPAGAEAGPLPAP